MASEITAKAFVSSHTSQDQPLPLSFPAILRNSSITTRFAHLHSSNKDELDTPPPTVVKKTKRGENEGKRWVRRKENGTYTCSS